MKENRSNSINKITEIRTLVREYTIVMGKLVEMKLLYVLISVRCTLREQRIGSISERVLFNKFLNQWVGTNSTHCDPLQTLILNTWVWAYPLVHDDYVHNVI